MAALLLALMLATTPASAHEAPPQGISVTGEAERRVAPDMAMLSVAIERQERSAAPARREADAVTSRALQLLRDHGVADQDIDSSGLTVSPQYRWNKNTQEQELIGYRVTRSISIRLLDLEKLGEVLTGLTEAGVNRVGTPRMGLQDDEAVYQAVLAEAAENARARAGAIARTLDESLGDVLHASTFTQPPARPMMMERAMLAAADSETLGAESYQSAYLTYRVSLNVTFALR